MPPKRKLAAFRGPLPERFTDITWNEANRLRHEAKRPFPAFATAKQLDWSRVMKRKDIEHPGPPDRFQALVSWKLGPRTVVFFVAYSKENGRLNVISIRQANSDECEVFFKH